MARTVKDIAEFINGELKGDGSVQIKGVSSVTDAKAGDITFVDNPSTMDECEFPL